MLSLRERSPFSLYGTAATLATVEDNAMFGALASDVVKRHPVLPGIRFAPVPGIEAELFLVPGKVPLYLEGDRPETALESAVNVGIEISCGKACLAYVPGAAAITPAMKRRLQAADVIMFDGTVLTDDEMIRAGTGEKTGRRMGHMPLSGVGGSIAELADMKARRIFIHINNTNPILIDGSQARAYVEAAGWEVAEDGLRLVL